MSFHGLTILSALADPQLFGGLATFKDPTTWRAWLVFLAAVYGRPLSELVCFGIPEDEALKIFRHHTGLTTYAPPPGGYRLVITIVGRQCGKSTISITISNYEAIQPGPVDGTETYALLIAQDQRSALRTLLSYAKAPFEQLPLLKQVVIAQTRDSMTLSTGCVLAAYPCRPAAVRGLRARVVVCDELAFYRSTENVPVDTEMLRAVRPTLATTGGKLIVLSSPYAQTGALHDLHRKHFGRAGSVLVWTGTAPEMNPTLPADYLERMAQDDPEAYRSEVLGEFRAGVSTFLDPEAIADCVADGVKERLPVQDVTYYAAVDASGGRRDAFTLAIAHRTSDRKGAVLDLVRAWEPPFDPRGVIAEIASILSHYGVWTVHGDRYAGEFVPSGFRAHQITYKSLRQDRSGLYLDLLPLINAQEVLLLDEPELLKELRGLERRRGSSGRDRVDHRSGGAHDDRANAAAASVVVAVTSERRKARAVLTAWGGGGQSLASTRAVAQIEHDTGLVLGPLKVT